jgi:hypothetical protein
MHVRIYKPTKLAVQSGHARTHFWLIEAVDASARKPEPIMGWLEAEDPFSELKDRLRFPTLDDALAFAKNKGWDVTVTEPNEPKIAPQNYLDNFKIVRPLDEERAFHKKSGC